MAGPGEEKVPDGKRLAYCRNYQIAAAGKSIKSTWQGEVKDIQNP